MGVREEILDAVQILIDQAMKISTKIYLGSVTVVNTTTSKCDMIINGKNYIGISYQGNAPIVGKSYRVFVPEGNMSIAFIIS